MNNNYQYETYDRPITRGDILYIHLGNEKKKGLLSGIHPCLVFSNDKGNRRSPTIQVVPFTSSQLDRKMHQPTHVLVEGFGLPKKSMALLEQFRTVSKEDVVGYRGHIDMDTHQGKMIMKSIEKAHLISCGISVPMSMAI